MNFTRKVKIENVTKKMRIAIKVVLHINWTEVVTELQDGLFGVTAQEASQACLRESFQNCASHSLFEAPDVDINEAVIRAVLVQDLSVAHSPLISLIYAKSVESSRDRGACAETDWI